MNLGLIKQMNINKILTFTKLLYYSIITVRSTYKSTFMTNKETVEYIIKNKKSLIRLGDGEFNFLSGKNIHYQLFDKNLFFELQSIITEFITLKDQKHYLLCMPGEFLKPNIFKLNFDQIKSWAFGRYYFKKNLDKKIEYGDAFLFAKDNEPLYKKIWLDTKPDKVIFVHNSIKYAEQFEKKYKINTVFIKVPEKNAYNNIIDIENKIKEFANKNSLILLSAGPCAKVIVFHLKEYWCIDTGHCWDSPLNLLSK